MEDYKMSLIIPEGAVNLPKVKLATRPESLEHKTVFLRWNGKQNGNFFLDKIAVLLTEAIAGIQIIKSWEVLPETATSSRNSQTSQEFAKKIAAFKPDLVIASQAD